MLSTLLWIFPHVAIIAGFLLAGVAAVHMLRQRHSPAGTTAWLLAMVLLPYVGVPLYLALGGRKMRRDARAKSDLRMPEHDFQPLEKVDPIDRLLRTYGIPGATRGNRLRLCLTGEEIYTELVRMIETAETSIGVTTFILGRDEVGRDILDRLTRRAAEGLQVRLLLDGVGSLPVGRRFRSRLHAAGGRSSFFMPVLHRPFHGRTNLRNHRKNIIADNRKVMAGGVNIAGEYIGGESRPGRWKDLAFVLEGPAVRDYAEIFRMDWEFATGEQLPPAAEEAPAAMGNAVVQVVPSGPDVPGDPLYGAILTAAFSARRRLWIVTPYFVPDSALVQALCLAGQRGVDVRVMVPERSNHRLADLARGSSLREVQAGGGRILQYAPGMLHAKMLIMDDELGMLGSANFDFRSLFLNYEAAVFVYGPELVRELEVWFHGLESESRAGIPTEIHPARDIYEGLVRMVSPLL